MNDPPLAHEVIVAGGGPAGLMLAGELALGDVDVGIIEQGRSLVRKQAGIAFQGWEPSISYLIFEAEMSAESALGICHGEKGIYAIGPMEDGKRMRGVVTEPELNLGDAPNLDELRNVLTAAYGTDLGVHNVTWLSKFTDAARQAETYRDRRVLQAGDAAHVHSPAGGQGLQIGLQDAVNLGWKLAWVVKGIARERLLDTYETERQPVAAAVLKHTLAITALNRGDERTTALREMMADVMQRDEPRKWYTALMSGLDIRYDFGQGHPLLGRRMPDLDLLTSDGPVRVFTLMYDARPLLLNFGEPGAFDAGPWSDRVKTVAAKSEKTWHVPVIGDVSAPGAVLIRPDGYVAWAGDRSDDGLDRVLAGWRMHKPSVGSPSVVVLRDGFCFHRRPAQGELPCDCGNFGIGQETAVILVPPVEEYPDPHGVISGA